MVAQSKRKKVWQERYFWWWLGLGLAIAMAMSFCVGLAQSVWFDEAYSIMLAKRPIGDLVALTSIDTHPPVYYLLLKLWAGLFGWSEAALRSLSVLAMGGAAVFGILSVRRMFGVKAAIATLPFVVLAPFLLRYGFEIRMYALASLVGAAATYVLACAVDAAGKKQTILYVVYGVLVALGMLTLYYTVLLWATHLVWLIWQAWATKQAVVRQKWWLGYVVSILAFLLWLPTFLKQMGNGALAPISQQLTTDNMIGVVSFWFIYQPAWQLNGVSSLLIVVIITTLVYVIMQAKKSVKPEQKKYYGLLALYAGLPVLLIAIISLIRPMYVERYLAHVLLGWTLFMGVSLWFMAGRRPYRARFVFGILVAVLCYGIVHMASVGNFNFQRLQTPQVKEAAAILPCSTIVAADPYVAIELSYYVTKCPIYFYSDIADLKGGYAPLAHSWLRVANVTEQFKTNNELTLVYYDQLKLAVPAKLHMTKDVMFGALHVTTFSAE